MPKNFIGLVRLVISFYLFAGVLMAQTPAPSVSLSNSSTTAWETDRSSIDLDGTVKGLGDVSNVVWVNQVGKRGVGTWTVTGAGMASWEVRDLALRPGINQITVTTVDAANHSASLHVVVNRRVASGSQSSLEVRSGTWKNQPIEYQVRNGMAIVEGDIILAPVASVTSVQGNSTAPAQASKELTIKPDGLAISYSSQFWPQVGGVFQVPYVISGTGSTTILSDAIGAFNSQFSGLIQFVKRGTQANYVNIDVASGGGNEGFSQVGMAGGEQDLDCGDGCSIATWLHEMGHTVGLYHEQQRPDRASYINFNLANADLPNVPGNFTLLTDNYQSIGLFDDASVMEYGAFVATKAGLPVIETIPPGMPLSNDTGYSAGDIDQIERLYGATPSAVTVTTNPPGLQITVDGSTATAPKTFSWTLGTTHTITVPADPQTLSTPDGSTYAFGAWNDLGAKSHTITVQPGAGALTTPINKPAVTMYQANFVRLQPFSIGSPSVTPAADGTASVSPTPLTEFGGSFFPDRTLVTLTLSPTPVPGDNFYGWSSIPYPTAENPHSFFIQAPTSPTQAVFVSSPVTIIGESITGPNTWNPGLVAYVDSAFNYLPSAFYNDSYPVQWTAGTSHTITMPPQPPTAPLPYQSPITTNVYYNWNSWSDGGSISHSVVQPASGTQTITASFDPFYASYTVPGATGSCYGSVTTSPAGTSYAENGSFGFYQGGKNPTSVTATATANSAFPGMVFTGWSGSLTGTTNPQTVAIQDQFVPTANFNTTSAPLAITSYSPSTAPASSAAMDITINGTGFTPTTFVNWNGARKASTYVSSTQLTLHLVAGDLANPGGQDVFIGNSVTNSSNATCLVSFESSYMVTTAQPQPPTFVSLTPNSGSGATQTFSLVISDPAGLTDLKTTHLLFNTTSANQTSACSLYYAMAANQLSLYNDGGTSLSAPLTPGGAGTASNSQCAVTASGSSISKSGNNLTLNVALTFTATFTGLKNVYAYASGNDGLSSGWVQEGTWTPGTPQPPTFVSLTPNSGSGATQTFSLVISDPAGLTDLKTTHLLFNTTSANQTSACSLYYAVAANQLSLYNDGGTSLSAPLTPGGAGTASNSQCAVTASGSSISKSGNNLTLNVALTFTATFTGLKNVYAYASGNDGLSSGWVQEGTWTPGTPQPPTFVSLTPNSGSGATQTFSLVISDPAGLTDLKTTHLLFNTTSANQTSACSLYYAVAANQLSLYNDGGTSLSAPLTPGGAGTASNSQCAVTASGSSISKSGNNLTLNVALTFTATFTGLKNVYAYASGNDGLSSGWVQEGTWTPGTPQPPTFVSLTPNSGSGATQTFSLVISDPAGLTDLKTTHLLFNTTSANQTSACSLYYAVAANQLSLYNDGGTSLSAPLTPGGAGTASNSQCAVTASGSSISKSGNNLTLNVALTFTATFTGLKNVYAYASGNDGLSSGWVQAGTWTP